MIFFPKPAGLLCDWPNVSKIFLKGPKRYTENKMTQNDQ